MLTLIRNGGVLSMLFILLTGLVSLAAAFHFALRADRRTLGFLRQMMLATLFGTLAATCGDVGATLYAAGHALGEKDSAGPALRIVIEGCAESTSPGILGFAFLALAAMLGAVARRRLDEREPAALR